MKICFWGTYDTGKPRVRILLDGLKTTPAQVAERHVHVWRGVEDKSQAGLMGTGLRIIALLIIAYPWLLLRHLFSPKQDIVICGYPAYLDFLIIWPLARLRGEKILLDAFVPYYDTLVHDRKLLRPGSIVARLVHRVEALCCRNADLVLTDTDAHADYYSVEFEVDRDRFVTAFVGHEATHFAAARSVTPADPAPVVLFYGQFIPLHGIDTIIAAARLAEGDGTVWRVIGRGQEAARIRSELDQNPAANVDWIPWVDYADLQRHIAGAAVCLGIFGTSGKAARVIPNKVFQIIACDRPLVTRQSPAISELLKNESDGVALVPAGDADALYAAVRATLNRGPFKGYSTAVHEAISGPKICMRLLDQLTDKSLAI